MTRLPRHERSLNIRSAKRTGSSNPRSTNEALRIRMRSTSGGTPRKSSPLRSFSGAESQHQLDPLKYLFFSTPPG